MMFVAVNVKLTQTIEIKTSKMYIIVFKLYKNSEFFPFFRMYGIFRSYDSNDNGWIALFFMLFLVLTTSLGVVCYKKRWYKVCKNRRSVSQSI